MKKYIEEYFKNPENVMGDSIFVNPSLERLSCDKFFELEARRQSESHIVFNHIKCKDGFTMSVQASYWHYCSPRITVYSKDDFFYKTMEVWFPSKKVEKLMPYACQDDWEGVYSQVPVGLLNEIIEEHGWIA